MYDFIEEDMDLLDAVQLEMSIQEDYIQEGLFKKIREIIKSKNKNKKSKDNSDSDRWQTDTTPYTRKVIHSGFNKFYNNNDFIIECVTGDDELCQIIANILNSKYKINTPVNMYVITGKDMNKEYDLSGDNAYQDNVHHVIIPLSTLKNSSYTAAAKESIGARYFNDVVDNNEYREYLAGRHKASDQIQWIIDYHDTH